MAAILCTHAGVAAAPVSEPSAQPREDWWANSRDGSGNRFSPLDEIKASNVARLQVVWEWDLPLNRIAIDRLPARQFGPNEGTPIKVGRYLYTATAASQVAKFDLDTGQPVADPSDESKPLVYDPELYRGLPPEMVGFVHRGLAYWRGTGGQERIFLARGDARLVALDPDDLTPVEGFGRNGVVVLHEHSEPDRSYRYTVTSPPVLCRDTVIVGSSIADLSKLADPPRGDVQAYDALTGAAKWTFRTIPTPEDLAAIGLSADSQWRDGSHARAGHANVWTLMSADPEIGYAYLPVSGASNDSYGGGRKGNNLFSQSLVAVSCDTGERIWHRQLVHHDLWDYDLPAAPNLVDIVDGGEVSKLIAQVTKQGYTYVFDRITGEPRWELREIPVPPSGVRGEQTSPTQPIPARPAPFDHQGVYPSDHVDVLGRRHRANIIDFTPALRARTLEVLGRYRHGALFTPPSLEGTIQVPGYLGGASWAGAVVNPATGSLFVSSITQPHVNQVEALGANAPHAYFSAGPASWPIKADSQRSENHDLPVLKPPWGRITAIDLATGERAWPRPVPVGAGPREALIEAVGEENLPDGDLGWNRRTHLLATPELLLAGQEAERRAIGYNASAGVVQYALLPDRPSLLALDPSTGARVAEIRLPAHAQGGLMSFAYGARQFIAIPVGGFNLPSRILGLRLEE